MKTKTIRTLLLLAGMMFTLTACGGSGDDTSTPGQGNPDPGKEIVFSTKYVGGDISLLTKYEQAGAKYYDLNNQPIGNLLTFLKNQKLTTLRVRLFLNPANASDEEKGWGACQDLAYVKALGKRIKDAGFKLMVDFHYSDTWADPSNQWTPKEWAGLTDEQLYTKIYDYTKASLEELKAAGATPDLIQTGNEISYGMLWGEVGTSSPKKCYTSSTANWSRFIKLLSQAGKACREVCPNAKIIIHTERAAQTNVLQGFYAKIKEAGLDYDVIGLSYYPYYHGTLAQLDNALKVLESNFADKEIMIVETGYFYAWQPTVEGSGADLQDLYPITPAGQQAFTKALVDKLNTHKNVTGLFWWMLEACENGTSPQVRSSWYNASLFNDAAKVNGQDDITYDYPAGKAMPAISELQNFK